jgi:hypothetical protein
MSCSVVTGEHMIPTASISANSSFLTGFEGDIVIFADGTDADNAESVVLKAGLISRKGCKLHIVITGRPFNSLWAAAIMVEGQLQFELDGEVVRVHPRDIGKYLVQSASDVYNPEEAQLLLGLYAAHLRLILIKFGLVEGTHFEIYDGGIAKYAGVSHIVYYPDQMRNFGGIPFGDPDFNFEGVDFATHFSANNGKIATFSEITDFKNRWFELSKELRPHIFRKIATAPPDHLRQLRPLSDLWTTLRENPEGEIEFYGAGPATAIAETPSDIASRVSLFQAMSGTDNGSKNLLGGCYNDLVDYDAYKAISSSSFFPNAMILYVPTDTVKCDCGAFTLTLDEFKKVGDPAVMQDLYDIRSGWVLSNRGNDTPMFDSAAVLPVSAYFNHASITEVNIRFGDNLYQKSGPFGNKGVFLDRVGKPLTDVSQMRRGRKYAVTSSVDASMKPYFIRLLNFGFRRAGLSACNTDSSCVDPATDSPEKVPKKAKSDNEH